ncbi:hypothetical protein N184_28635 [Sinorhizobium sp. GL28]|nr:hypothetical protein N184_28635 [Sinorhizobium sp. GL28]
MKPELLLKPTVVSHAHRQSERPLVVIVDDARGMKQRPI